MIISTGSISTRQAEKHLVNTESTLLINDVHQAYGDISRIILKLMYLHVSVISYSMEWQIFHITVYNSNNYNAI